MKPSKEEALNRTFEGRARLDALLALAGSISDTEDVAEAFTKALLDDVPCAVVIAALFEDEPRFPKASDAAALYGNLFGLWDQLEAGEPLEPKKPFRPKPPKQVALPPPTQFPKEGPSAEWLEAAWRYVEECAPKERTRLEHAFENRQDALITWLDESGADDAVYGGARQILFELFAMLELGAPAGVGRIDGRALTGPSAGVEIPQALAAWAQEAVFQAATDEDEPLAEEGRQQLERFVETALAALWSQTSGVKHGGQGTR